MNLTNPLPEEFTSYRLNKTLHGRSVHRPANVRGHNVFKGYKHPGTGDGGDLFCEAGTPVKAMHSGQIGYINRDRDNAPKGQDYGPKSVLYLEGVQQTIDVTTVYAHIHIKDDLKAGKSVTAGQVIGYVGRLIRDPHLHLEVWIDGKAISGKRPAAWAESVASRVTA